MDEAPICYENIKATITKIGTQKLTVKNFNKDKLRIIVLLPILSDGINYRLLLSSKVRQINQKKKNHKIMNTLKKDYVL